jgi:hypothetical protein
MPNGWAGIFATRCQPSRGGAPGQRGPASITELALDVGCDEQVAHRVRRHRECGRWPVLRPDGREDTDDLTEFIDQRAAGRLLGQVQPGFKDADARFREGRNLSMASAPVASTAWEMPEMMSGPRCPPAPSAASADQ